MPRYNSDAKCELVQWQPMVKGVQLAGKRAGILASLNAQFVLAGEPFRYLALTSGGRSMIRIIPHDLDEPGART